MLDFLNKIKSVFVSSVPDTSPSGVVNKTDTAKLIKTGTLVGIAAALSYVVTNLDPTVLGPYQPIIMMGLTMGLDFLNKMVKSNTK